MSRVLQLASAGVRLVRPSRVRNVLSLVLQLSFAPPSKPASLYAMLQRGYCRQRGS